MASNQPPHIVLHQREHSAACAKAWRVLRFKGLAFKTVMHGPAQRQNLPVLDYDQQRLRGSSVIALFVEHRHPTPALFPQHPVLRARAKVLADWADSGLARLCDLQGLAHGLADPPLTAPQGLETSLGRDTLLEDHLGSLEVMVHDQGWLVGAACSIADIAVAAQLRELVQAPGSLISLATRPALLDWYQRTGLDQFERSFD